MNNDSLVIKEIVERLAESRPDIFLNGFQQVSIDLSDQPGAFARLGGRLKGVWLYVGGVAVGLCVSGEDARSETIVLRVFGRVHDVDQWRKEVEESSEEVPHGATCIFRD